MKNGLLILLFVELLSACTSVQVLTPNPHVESPELRGDRGLKIGATETPAHVYTATDDAAARPPVMDQPTTGKVVDLGASFLYSPVEPFEFGLETHLEGASAVAKYQLSGAGTRTADAGNVPIGVYLRVGESYSHSNGNQLNLFGPGGYPWDGTMYSVYVHTGASIGYRLNERVLIFGGIAAGEYWNNSEIDQNNSPSNNSPGAVYHTNDSGTAETIGPGVLFSWKYLQFYFTGEFSHIQYLSTRAENDLALATGIFITPR